MRFQWIETRDSQQEIAQFPPLPLSFATVECLPLEPKIANVSPNPSGAVQSIQRKLHRSHDPKLSVPSSAEFNIN